MEKIQRLKDPGIEPTSGVIAEVLGKAYPAYAQFTDGIKDRIILEWRYYNDGKAWLGKAQAKKKTVFWLSVWEGFFMISFYFTEKTIGGIQDLAVDSEIKARAANAVPIGKLMPLTFEVREESEISDLFKVIDYKRNLK